MAIQHAFNLLVVSNPTKGVRLLALNRPQKRNALSQQLIREILQALSDASLDPNIHAVVITGCGSFFCGVWSWEDLYL